MSDELPGVAMVPHEADPDADPDRIQIKPMIQVVLLLYFFLMVERRP